MVHLALLDKSKDSSIASRHQAGSLNRHQPLSSRQETCRGKPPGHLMEARRLSYVDPYRQEFDLFQLEDIFLLHLCHKNDWKNVERLCCMISKIMQDNDDASGETLLKVKRAKKQLLTVDQWGNAALHLVCYHKPPAYVVSALLMACQLVRAWCTSHHHLYYEENHDFVLYPNHHGATPLLIACRSGACQAVLQLLMQGDSRALLPPGYQAVHVADEEGNTVFTGLVQRYSMLCKVPHYKRYCTSLYARANNNTNNENEDEEDEQESGGHLEITFDGIQFELSSSHCRMPWDEDGQAGVVQGSLMPTTTTTMIPEALLNPSTLLRGHKRNKNAARIFPELWENISMLMDAAWNDSLDEEPGNTLRQLLKAGRYKHDHKGDNSLASSCWFDFPMHATALVADALPPSIIDLLLRLHHQDWIKHKEDDAVHPIHFAVIRNEKTMVSRSPRHHHPQEEAHCRYRNNSRIVASVRRQSHLLERFMAMDPGSARLCLPHLNKNRTVFHQAIASGWTWHSSTADGEPGPLQILFRASPGLLTQRDEETGLYPFQLAAAAASVELSPSYCYQEPQEELQVVDTIFQLLRKAPEVLTHVV